MAVPVVCPEEQTLTLLRGCTTYNRQDEDYNTEAVADEEGGGSGFKPPPK